MNAKRYLIVVMLTTMLPLYAIALGVSIAIGSIPVAFVAGVCCGVLGVLIASGEPER